MRIGETHTTLEVPHQAKKGFVRYIAVARMTTTEVTAVHNPNVARR